MSTRILTALVVLATTTLVSTNALAWAVPIHKCSYPDTPTPVGDPIPCSYTNEDGQTFYGVVTSSTAGVFCTGMAAPTPSDPTVADDVAALYSEFGENPDEVPECRVQGSIKGAVLECPIEGEPWAAVKICGDNRSWCLELTRYTDCADYYSSEPAVEGITCDDVQ